MYTNLAGAKFIEVHPSSSFVGTVQAPASKSTSTRSILTASLSEGESKILNCARSNNANAMKYNCGQLGASINDSDSGYQIQGVDVTKIDRPITFNPGNSGVVLRLLMGVAGAMQHSTFVTDFSDSLGKRAHIEMVMALSLLGVSCNATGKDGLLPIQIAGGRLSTSYTEISCRKSSQFLSGLLYLGAVSDRDLHIKVTDKITAPSMVRTTIHNLKSAGIDIEFDDGFKNFYVSGSSRLQSGKFVVGSDPASSAALMGICAVTDSDVALNGFYEEELGNGAVIDYLCSSGVHIDQYATDILKIQGGNPLKAQDFDGSLAPDAVPALAAVAAFADGKSTFYNIEHLRYKECDRISDFRRELSRLGVRSEESNDSLTIYGRPEGYEGGVTVDGHYDHAIIMALTTIGSRCKNSILIRDPFHVGQTYPNYFRDMHLLGNHISSLHC